MNNLIILKLGGSIITDKGSADLIVRTEVLDAAARAIADLRVAHPDVHIIVIHGAGGPAHHLAHEYGLRGGTGVEPRKLHGALISQHANNRLNAHVMTALTNGALPATALHTASIITMTDGTVSTCDTDRIQTALAQNLIPVLYGDMVLDTTRGMSVCSGDAIAPYLAQHLGATQLFYATDVAGIFAQDPHIHPDAPHFSHISVHEALTGATLSTSHNTDVTGGLRGKVEAFAHLFDMTNLESVIIFDGSTCTNWNAALTDPSSITHTKVTA